jgi:uncharacterized protein YdaU (DUF1376 family)
MKVRRIDFSPDEWLAGTLELSNLDRGTYITVCALIYSRGGPITDELVKLHCSIHGNSLNASLERLAKAGKITRNGVEISQKRCGKELETAQKRVRNWRENGEKGGRPSSKNKDLAKPKGFSSTRARGTINHQPSTDSVASATGADAPSDDPVKELFDRGLKILGMAQRALLGKFRKRHGDVVVLEAICACEREQPSDPAAYFVRCCEAHAGKPQRKTPVTTLWEGAYHAALKWDQEHPDRRDGGKPDEPLLGRRGTPAIP